jgi:septum formation inhibitor MinC
MNEQEFDQKIRESALRHESQIEKPLWNKDGVWSRIDSGLEKKNHSVWWKAAAVILILLSTGWSFAQWNNFRQYKHDKELELSELRKQLDQSIESKEDKIYQEQMVIQQQNQELDSLKKQIRGFVEISRKTEVRKPIPVKNEVADISEKQTTQQNLIDSLQNQLRLIKELASNSELANSSEEKKPAKQEIANTQKEVLPERRIYYISNHDQPQNTKKGRGFKIGFFESPEDENIEYQSDHSIFKKQ